MKAYLTLTNGNVYEGDIKSPLSTNISGEVVFFTGMTGYQEVLTDPSYKGQIIVFTYPLIGNYGINAVDFESNKPHVAGVIVYEAKESLNHFEAEKTLEQYLRKWNVPLITHIDTRAIVKTIRDSGTMLGQISHIPHTHFSKIKHLHEEKLAVAEVSTKNNQTLGTGFPHILVIDFGYKQSIVEQLIKRGCMVTIVPYHTNYNTITEIQPDGILLSNGPGDPKALENIISELKKILSNYPTLAICLGHQLVCLTFGANTLKLSFGHRGANQPVRDLTNNKVFMTSQNHSYVVDEHSLSETSLQPRFVNVNDRSIEGVTHKTLPILTVQYHPEANPGPVESEWVFDEFIDSVCAVRGEKVYA
ncbi:carbamoyl phosphate synthase small subunit [Cytobacillus sp. IB215316]|uniref:carbamoyl phosphate synthase small subunit n=1 Tax=Cytobacillus sp. IB215316 TaxID=3097354 RepID=UPI002A113DFB|nr:carbamoyl phosphate synthase small subunit [Cytobacillus sp. IB215316]MDX8361401.1 carbamoyl phosphate synthase small subunit [Cytobacillus sp. IB215316]